jgi:hypothetical protein
VGWSVPFASAWPVDAIVAENGAVALRRNAQGGLDKLYQQSADERARNFARMQQVLEQIEATVPGANAPRTRPAANAISPWTTANSRTCPRHRSMNAWPS